MLLWSVQACRARFAVFSPADGHFRLGQHLYAFLDYLDACDFGLCQHGHQEASSPESIGRHVQRIAALHGRCDGLALRFYPLVLSGYERAKAAHSHRAIRQRYDTTPVPL